MTRRWLSPVTAVAVVALLSLGFGPTNPLAPHRKPKDVARIRTSIARERAAVVVLGNSMVGRGIHGALLERLLGVPVYRLYRNSMRSAWWYLALKNVLAEVSPRPKLAVICFRNTVLTDPTRAVHGKHKEAIGQLATEHEPLLRRVAYLSHLDDFQCLLHRYWGLFQRREHVQRLVEDKVKKHVARRLFDDLDEEDVDEAIERVLADENMDEALITARQAYWEEPTDPRAYDFHARVRESFLPHIIEVAARSGIQLVFVRLKTRRDAAHEAGRELAIGPHPRPRLLRRYISDLRAYLEGRDVPLLDFTDTPLLKLRHFREHDHLGGNGRRILTRLLAEALLPHLQDGSPASSLAACADSATEPAP